MRPGALKRALVVAGCGVLTVTVSACESTEQESAKIGKQEQANASAGTLKLGASNHSVRVSDVTLVSAGGRMAVAARLTSSSSATQGSLPVLVNVTGKGGKILYTNGTAGLEASLQHLGLLKAHQSAWWVDDQVLISSSEHKTTAKLQVGSGSKVSGSSSGSIATTGVHAATQGGTSVLSGRLVNHSTRAQGKVLVYAVALKGGRVVAAGRSVVASLPAHQGASAPFQAFLVGNPAGAKIELSAVPAKG